MKAERMKVAPLVGKRILASDLQYCDLVKSWYSEDDIRAAVEWLKKELKWRVAIHEPYFDLIDEAFADVIKKK